MKKRVGAVVKLVQVQTAQPAVQVQVGGLAGQTSVTMKISTSQGGKAFKVINDHGDADELLELASSLVGWSDFTTLPTHCYSNLKNGIPFNTSYLFS